MWFGDGQEPIMARCTMGRMSRGSRKQGPTEFFRHKVGLSFPHFLISLRDYGSVYPVLDLLLGGCLGECGYSLGPVDSSTVPVSCLLLTKNHQNIHMNAKGPRKRAAFSLYTHAPVSGD